MSNSTIKSAATTLGLTIRPWRAVAQLSIAARLALSFVAVAALAVVANLIAEGKVTVLRTTQSSISGEASAPAMPPPATHAALDADTVAEPAPAAPRLLPFPSPDALLRAIDKIDRMVDESGEGDAAEIESRYQKLATELDHAATEFAVGARAAGESAPARFLPTVKSYRQHGADLIKLTSSRRATMAEYSTHFEQLNTRVKQSLDHAWSIFGRVVARQSLVKLTSDIDDLRHHYAEFTAADNVDSATFDTLGASEGALEQTLLQNRDSFMRSQGAEWYTKSTSDLQAMSTARKALLQIDRQRREGARLFGEDGTSLSQTIGRMGKARTFVQPGALAPGQASAGVGAHAPGAAPGASPPQTPAAVRGHAPAGTEGHAQPAPSIGADGRAQTAPFAGLPAAQAPSGPGETVSTTTVQETSNTGHRALLAWLSAAVLLLVVYISAGTALSIVRPVRRLLDATTRLAKGENGVAVPRGGIRELDTLALAFNDMAAQLAVAQATARDQNNVLESRVQERTMQLQELAQIDPLTRLANRRHFFTLLNSAIGNASHENRRVGVFFLDIDNFKNMNDSLGHAFGDHVLQTIAQRLAHSTQSFGFAARLGGDEFTVVYESASSVEDIRMAGLKLIEAFLEPVPLEGRDLVVSVSAGASVFPDHGDDADSLLAAADAALFEAKALGRSQLVVFTPELLAASKAKFTTEQGLRRALDRGEFELVFQPEVNLQTCETELVEALLRWRMPDGRIAAPGEFLNVAEASGLILKINDWVLRRVVETAARWHHGPWPDARVAINVSSRQLFDNSFVDQVRDLLDEFKLPARCIEIELTENVMQTGSATIAALRRLRAHGIAIALDDFGTGFSSLASLEQLPLTRIKLDRSLISSIDTSARSASIARAIIQLCHGLGLSLTAEGIERPEQLGRLAGYPALYAQGFLLAPPASYDELIPVMSGLKERTRALVRSSAVNIPDSEMAEKLPFVASIAKR